MHTLTPRPDDTPAADKALADWREAVANATAAMEASNAVPPDADLERADRQACERVRQLARDAWAIPVSGPGGLRLRAEIVRHALWAYDDGMRRFEAVLAGEDAKDGLEIGHFGERAVAELVRAILWTPGAAEPARDEPAAPPEPTQADAGDGRGGDALPGDLEDLIGNAQAGIATLRTVWHSHLSTDSATFLLDRNFALSLFFCIEGIDAQLERMEAMVEATFARRGRGEDAGTAARSP